MSGVSHRNRKKSRNDLPSVGHHDGAVVLRNDAERVRIGFVIHTTHRLCVDVFEFNAQTHTLAVASKTGGKIAAATIITAAVTTRANFMERSKDKLH